MGGKMSGTTNKFKKILDCSKFLCLCFCLAFSEYPSLKTKDPSVFNGIVCDSNIFLWHESEDITKEKKLFPKFQLIRILRLQVMHDYVHWQRSIDYYVKYRWRYFMWKLPSFHTKMILLNSFAEMDFLKKYYK